MKLAFVHQLLIGSAIGLCAIYGLRSLVVGARAGSTPTMALGLASFAAMVGLAFYLRRFREKLAARKNAPGA